MEKTVLQGSFWIIGDRNAVHDIMNDIHGGDGGEGFGFQQFAIGVDEFFCFLPFLVAGRSAERK
ncbi:hypothetical protein FMM75_01945 [Lachnospiraceae bacterium MD335]|nr:hypothetical protein [Lachnospiraceae bacterium MD335]